MITKGCARKPQISKKIKENSSSECPRPSDWYTFKKILFLLSFIVVNKLLSPSLRNYRGLRRILFNTVPYERVSYGLEVSLQYLALLI